MFIKKFEKIIVNIMVVILFVSYVPYINVSADDEKKEVIRVGYLENYGVVKTPSINGYEGYGYEYLRKMEQYIDYEFEFVLCDWSDAIDLLRLGEIDVFAPARMTEERMEEFYFTENYFAKEVILLISEDSSFYDESSYNLINGSVIGVRDGGASSNYLNDFIEKYNLKPKIVNHDTTNFSQDIKTGKYDFLVTGSLQMETDFNIAINLGSSLNYFMGTNQELIAALDYAMNKIEDENYLFQENLQSKYFNHEIGANQYISRTELNLIQNSTYDVGVISMYHTFGYNDEDAIDNVSVDVLKRIVDILSVDFNFIEISAESTTQELDELDFYIYLNGYQTDIYNNKSVPFMEDSLLLIDNVDSLKNTTTSNKSIGVLDYYNLDKAVVEDLTGVKNVKYYPSVSSLITSLENGEVSSILLANSIYELLYVLIKPINHTTNNLFYPILPTIVYTNDFPVDKIKIIDKAISYITDDDINTMLLNNMSLITELERKYMYNRYIAVILTIIVSLYILLTILYKKRKKDIERIANYDRLTKLYTPAKFIVEARELFNKNPDKKYTIYALDIDNFKYINELYGFEVGDKILKTIGEFFRGYLPDESPIARLSSDHFILLLETNPEDEEHHNFHRIGEKLRSMLNGLIGNVYRIQYSVGCYEIEDTSISIEHMIDYCNLARSYSKKNLGTAVTVYSDTMNEKESAKNDIVFRMNRALEEKEFVLFYQPKYDIDTKKIIGAEALVRWFSDGKMMPPNDFIPLFEENGFIEKLDYYVIDTACKFIAENKNSPIISINLSAITLMKNDVTQRILAIVKKHSLKPEQIELEITESAFVNQFEIALQRINSLRENGFIISMDDFGSGVSSLGRLKNMEIDILKIDREFIIETLHNEKSDIILKNIIQMANQLDLKTIAEGIETKEQLDFLLDNGCVLGQGYFFSKPLPESEFLGLL